MNAKTDLKVVGNAVRFEPAPKAFLDLIASPAIIWSSPVTIFALNERAQRLIGFSESDFSLDNGLWCRRVDGNDKSIFAERQKQLTDGATEVTCDYRFYPKGAREPIHLREMIFSVRDRTREWKWISMYSASSDFTGVLSEARKGLVREEMRQFIGCLFHEIKNRLHLLSMELELAALEPGENFNFQKFANTLHELNHSIRELHNYLIPTHHGQFFPD